MQQRSEAPSYHELVHRHVLPWFGDRSVTAIDFMDVEQFLADMLRRGFSPKHVREAVQVMSLVMKSAVHARARRDNPAAGHTITVRRQKVRQGDVLTMDQVVSLIEHVRDPYKPAIWLLVMTGMRPAELCGLRMGNVDFVRSRVRIVETLLPVRGHDVRVTSLVEGPPKTDAGDREVPIPTWLAEQIAAMLADRARRRGATVLPADEYVFLNPSESAPLHRDRFRERIVLPALRAAGLPTRIRTYD